MSLSADFALFKAVQKEADAEMRTAPFCPHCHTGYRMHGTVPGVWYCQDSYCREYDKPVHVRQVINGKVVDGR